MSSIDDWQKFISYTESVPAGSSSGNQFTEIWIGEYKISVDDSGDLLITTPNDTAVVLVRKT